MKKRAISYVLLSAMMLSLAACGEQKPAESTLQPEPAAEETAEEATEEAETETEEAEATPVFEGTPLETEFWSLTYSDDWTFVEDDDLSANSGVFSSASFHIPQDEDTDLIKVEVSGEHEKPDEYRDFLRTLGDMQDIIENGSVEPVQMGGVDCYLKEGESWGDHYKTWMGRIEQSGVSVSVTVWSEEEDPRVDTLLDSLSFVQEDTGNVEPPWPWNGEPFRTEDHSHMVGTLELNAHQLPIDESMVVDDIFNTGVAANGEVGYIMTDGKLRQCTVSADDIKLGAEIPLDEEYDNMTLAKDGTVYMADFMKPLIVLKDGKKVASYEGPDDVTMHPSGEWGISFFSSKEVQKITLSDGAIKTENWSLDNVKTIRSVSISEEYIMVSAITEDTETNAILIYDKDGKLQMTLGGKEFGEPDSLGSVTSTVQTENGFMALDGNMRAVLFWKPDGSFIGKAEDSDLFGTTYPWMNSATLEDDGSILIGMTEEREDGSADEFIAFRLTGF